MKTEPPIVLDKFSKWYGKVIAVNHVSLTIGPGITGLLGPNGAGKTSFLRCISGQLKPNLGTIRVLQEDPWCNPRLAAKMGLCTDLGWLIDEMTALEFLSFDLSMRGIPKEKINKRVLESLDMFNLSHVVHRRISSLSRGTRQRVKLAQAFSFDPDVLVLDEPLTGIDPVARATTVEQIKKQGKRGKCVIVSSHILHEIEAMTEQVILLHKGKLIAYGNVMEIRDLLDKYPHRIAIECDRPRDLARIMVDLPSISGFSFPSPNLIEFFTQQPDECYSAIPARALNADIKIRSLTSPDASLEMLFKYLVGQSEEDPS